MNTPPFSPAPARLAGLSVYVRGLTIEAEIGVYAHEHGRRQPLIVDVEIELEPEPGPFEHLADILNYETIGQRAREIADRGHVKLVESYAESLAQALLRDSRVLSVRVRVDKPQALAPAVAGVEVRLTRS